jgi:peptidoglycan/xylan/chitin deacetylase (PgdA/CDA1 family)
VKKLNKGVFILWIELELAWGLLHRKKINLRKLTKVSIRVREILDEIFALLEKYRIPVTWAVVGHLLLDRCERNSGLPHSEMPRPHYSWLEKDWYRYDPCSDLKSAPAWYGRDLMDRIVKYVNESKLSHEIGCHTFSHQLFGDPGCTRDVARKEIEKCIGLMKNYYGIVPKVFAFPRDYVGHLDLLKQYRFIFFRDVPVKLYPCLRMERTLSNLIKTYSSLFIQFLSYYFLYPPHVVTVKESRPNLWGVSGCLAYSKKPFIPLKLVTFKAIQGINLAVRKGKIFSMYTHLRNFAEDVNMLSEFEHLLLHVSKKRKEGLLEVKTPIELVKERFYRQTI